MLKRQLGTLFLATCLILTTVPAVLGGENKQIINIAGDGSGDFNCDGKDDHAQINQALDYAASNPGTIVHFKVPLGAYYNNMATLAGCDGLTIQNFTFQNGCNDAMLISKSSNILIDKVTVNKCGHDGVYCP
jgi:polygalacturonase